jgi:hypothetical protein
MINEVLQLDETEKLKTLNDILHCKDASVNTHGIQGKKVTFKGKGTDDLTNDFRIFKLLLRLWLFIPKNGKT